MPYGAPGFGAPPGNPYGAQQNPYGYGAYGPPQGSPQQGSPQQGNPQQPAGMVPYGQPDSMAQRPSVGTQLPLNALGPWLLPGSVIVGGILLSVILSIFLSRILGLVVALLALGGGVWLIMQSLKNRSV